MMPFIYNSSMNKIKNLNNNNVYAFADCKVIENNEQLRDLIAKNFDKDSSELSFTTSEALILDYGCFGITPSLSSLTLFKLNLWLDEPDSLRDLINNISAFCDNTYASDYSRLTKVFQKGIQKDFKSSKKQKFKNDNNYQDRFMF